MITSMVPALLKTVIAPVVERPTVTWFGVGGLDGVQLRFEVTGRLPPAGKTVR